MTRNVTERADSREGASSKTASNARIMIIGRAKTICRSKWRWSVSWGLMRGDAIRQTSLASASAAQMGFWTQGFHFVTAFSGESPIFPCGEGRDKLRETAVGVAQPVERRSVE